jgi:hypothetical protein
MSSTTGKMTHRELGMKYGIPEIPPDDPTFKPGFTIGATVPYRQRPAGSTNEASSSAPNEELPDPMQPAIDAIEEMLKRDFGDRYDPKA